MKFKLASVALCLTLAACSGGNPFEDDDDSGTGDDGTTDGGTGITRDGVPPGTESPSAGTGLFRSEIPTDGGNGFARGISYDGDSDTFTVDNLAFDGANTYQRGRAVGSLGGGEFAVYEADAQYPDSITGAAVNQFTHRAIYGVSRNRDSDGDPTTQFAIVRTGAYIPYGFGGFIYQRGGSVDLPTTGQAIFRGQAGGLRDFDGAGALQYSTGDVAIAIDFDDFNESTGGRGDGVQGQLTNRQVFDINGNDITANVTTRINDLNSSSIQSIPAAIFTVAPGVLDNNGDLVGELTSRFVNDNGDVVEYESGNYYAIVSGDDPDEIVGVMVLENTSEFRDATVRDTSGFIVYRDPNVQP
ncbi:hypothetical protein C1J03_16335 [Sulfitobacter sp. SK012]|uniref:hypothetical protein n=1 Tax=Sulfitobacter sp. SK012 TaxID=1389005 RepID=UPI000E0C42CB|nr:hypothetical protein [Sulfitobacter sp. SK012]AXI47438.1 hypothetical protein C1J03_16335 [Sulfitobacter sp. SK012]